MILGVSSTPPLLPANHAYKDITDISNGDFKIVMSALKPFGDKSKIEDWQIVETGVFGVNDLT